MANQFGTLREFRPETDSVVSYLERADIFLTANGIADDKKVAVFLSSVGGPTYSLLRDLLAPEKPQDQTMGTLSTMLRNHFQPKPLIIAERFYFHSRNRAPTETIAQYMAELRKLATHCEFGAYLNDALRDRLLCGLSNSNIQKRLLSEDRLTLNRALKMAQGMEAAESNAKKLHPQPSEVSEIHAVRQPGTTGYGDKSGKVTQDFGHGSGRGKFCYRCGGTGHSPTVCKFRVAVCHKCQKTGHIAKVCRSKEAKPPITGRAQNYVSEVPLEEDVVSLLNTVGSQGNQPITVTVELNGHAIVMEVDTGAAVSLVPESVFTKYLQTLPVEKSSTILTTYTGAEIPVIGKIAVNVVVITRPKKCFCM